MVVATQFLVCRCIGPRRVDDRGLVLTARPRRRASVCGGIERSSVLTQRRAGTHGDLESEAIGPVEYRDPFGAIETVVPGVQLGALMPE